METTHQDLLSDESGKHGLPQVVRAIYFDPPWLFDSQFQKYIAELRALAKEPDSELSRSNPHFQAIRQTAMSGDMVDALNQIASAYQKRDDQETDFLQWWAIWDAGSTLLVLVLSVVLVFRPMVRRVRQDIDLLWRLKGNLEQLVAEHSALADKHASALAISEALYRSLVDHFPLQVNRKDLQGRFTLSTTVSAVSWEKSGKRSSAEPISTSCPPIWPRSIKIMRGRSLKEGRIVQGLEQRVRPTEIWDTWRCSRRRSETPAVKS